jgi:hypothetical protein
VCVEDVSGFAWLRIGEPVGSHEDSREPPEPVQFEELFDVAGGGGYLLGAEAHFSLITSGFPCQLGLSFHHCSLPRSQR